MKNVFNTYEKENIADQRKGEAKFCKDSKKVWDESKYNI